MNIQKVMDKVKRDTSAEPGTRYYECNTCLDTGTINPPIGHIVQYVSQFDKSMIEIVIDETNRDQWSIPCPECKPLRDARQMTQYQTMSKFTDAERAFRLDTMKTADGKGVRPGTVGMITAGQEMLAGTCHMLTIWGSYGNGKSHFLKAMCNEFLMRGTPALYINAFDLIQWVNDAFNRDHSTKGDESALTRIDMLKNIRVLCIDEFGAFKETDWNISLIESIVNHRWNQAMDGQAFTLLVMNEKPETLTPRILSRIKETRLREGGSPIIQNTDADVRSMKKGA